MNMYFRDTQKKKKKKKKKKKNHKIQARIQLRICTY